MRPTISWSDLADRRVGVWGLGVEGRASIRKLATLGIEPTLVDDQPPAAPIPDAGGRPVLATAAGGLDALRACDVVIKTPGKSRYDAEVRAVEDSGAVIVGGLGLWLQEADRSRVLCITGTKGKSTTTAIAGHLLSRLGYRVLCGGNIGQPPYDPAIAAADDVDYWIIEASSYQVTDFGVAPPVVAVTSLHPDHLSWHDHDTETYYRDKLSLCTLSGARVAVVNGDSDLLASREDLLGPSVRWVHASDEADALWMNDLGLLGEHNRRNALIARACLEELGVPEATDRRALAGAAQGFEPLASRLTPVATIDGVLFVDDSLSTNVLPTLAAVDAFESQRVAVLVGGADRGIDYRPLAAGLGTRTAPTLVVVVDSQAAPSIAAAFADIPLNDLVETTTAADEIAGARIGFDWARPVGVVLLSPAAPSFDRYRDYRERAEAFVVGVERCRS